MLCVLVLVDFYALKTVIIQALSYWDSREHASGSV